MGPLRVHRGHRLPAGLLSADVYFTPGYGRAAVMATVGEWILLEGFDGAWQVPLIVRTLVDGSKDAISPYGYSGVFASPSLSSDQVQQAWAATVACLQELAIISVLLRHSPLVPQAPHLPEQLLIVSGHPTIVLEPVDADSAWSSLAGGCRNQIRKALKSGYTGNTRQAESNDLVSGSDFRRIYEQTMQRLDAAPVFFFSDQYYQELLDGLGPDLLIAEVFDEIGAVASSMLLMRHDKRLHGHLSGSNRKDARMGANNLIIWTATQFAIEQGLDQYHLGGGRGERDGLFKFKSTFGGREVEYSVSGLVIDHDQYEARVRTRAKKCRTTPEALLSSTYFPAYRAGTESAQLPPSADAIAFVRS